MPFKEKAVNTIFTIATGNFRKKVLLTPVLGLIFISITLLFLIIPLYIDHLYTIPKLWHEPVNYILSFPVIFVGIILVLWSFMYFLKVRGTPVPINPPPKLITTGPYAYSRNPMTAGLFLQMFGVGIYFGSVLSVFIFTPLFIFIHYIELKKIEEPELEKRLGNDYVEYRKKVPMFFPWRAKYSTGDLKYSSDDLKSSDE